MRLVHRLLCFPLLGTFLFACIACTGEETSAPAAKEPTVGILLYNSSDSYISTVNASLQKNFPAHVKAIVKDGRGDSLLQTEQYIQLIEKKVDVLVLNIVDLQTASTFVDRAKKAGIPLVFFNREPASSAIRSYAHACFIGTTAAAAGVMQGDIIKKIWDRHPEFDRNKDGKFQYIMFQGNSDNPEALARTEYSIKQAKAKGVPMEQARNSYVCNWDRDLARLAMGAALSTGVENIEIIIANNDAMAIGAIEALASIGYNLENSGPDNFIPVVGVDALPEALEAIRLKRMSGTVKQDGEEMGRLIVQAAINALDGKAFIQDTGYEWDETGFSLRIPYSLVGGDY